MKKWKVIAPLSLIAAGALAAGIATLKKPAVKDGQGAAKPAPAAAKNAKGAGPAAPQDPRVGSYSFISGFQDAVTVDMEMDYDGARYSFSVIGEDFLCYTSDSHVAVIFGEDFNMQLEYAAYYTGEDFDALSKSLAEKFQGFGTVSYGANRGVKYCDGDDMRICLPVDEHSYLLVTILKAPGYDEEFTTLPDHPDVAAMLQSLRFHIHR